MSKNIIAWLVISLLFVVGAPDLFAQKYPNHPITLVIPVPPGDNIDISGRMAAEELSRLLNVPVIPLNKPGASMLIGTDFVAKSKKDGYTIILTNLSGLIQSKVLEPEVVPFDPFNDITPLGSYWASIFLIGVSGKSPYKNLKELIEYQKKNPAPISCGCTGIKSSLGLNVLLFELITGVKMTPVPFTGQPEVTTALLGGHTEAASVSISIAGSHLKSGAIRGTVISAHSAEFPELPTLKELGYKQNLLAGWPNFFVTAGVPKEVLDTLVPAFEKVAKNPAISSKLANLGMPMDYLPPDKVMARMHEEYKTVEELGKRFGMLK
jgi:tripartite-type tricarboxylate transporter receptor subunit TctC